ncbi:hypothetical protein DUNSADRAFT_3273 [Dunaliella salina]|uniref:Ndc10 domain-containing protein n=1 Tax=Dunaliella salina TaxID=3046 RepID=A0ABQ7FW40_DUNSA|nr:hypothetical protein DUNSADRAFT_3273 [Dunaliella salina]|eukprot:KAF5826407.1 hypothetical protein DUNSADRAFT_3273 [Dunaliella salina]
MHLIMLCSCSITYVILQCMMLVMHYGVGRSDDICQFRLADLAKPQNLRAGPCTGFVYTLVLRGGKKDQGGRAQHVGYVRNKNPHLCPVRAMGAYLYYKFTLGSQKFPSPRNRTQWLSTVLFTLKNPTKVLSYGWLNAQIGHIFKAAGVAIAKKCHAMRHAGARFLDQKGVSADDIRRYGRWEHEAMCHNYLIDLPPKGLLSHGDYPHEELGMENAYWHPRFLIDVPESLITACYPWLPQLELEAQQVGKNLPSATAVAEHVRLLAVALVQDTMHFCAVVPQFVSHCPLTRQLMQSQDFCSLLLKYAINLSLGAFERERPRSIREKVEELMVEQRLSEHRLTAFLATMAQSSSTPSVDSAAGNTQHASHPAPMHNAGSTCLLPPTPAPVHAHGEGSTQQPPHPAPVHNAGGTAQQPSTPAPVHALGEGSTQQPPGSTQQPPVHNAGGTAQQPSTPAPVHALGDGSTHLPPASAFVHNGEVNTHLPPTPALVHNAGGSSLPPLTSAPLHSAVRNCQVPPTPAPVPSQMQQAFGGLLGLGELPNIGMGSRGRGGMDPAGPAGMGSMGLAGSGDLPGIGIGSVARGGMDSMGLAGFGQLPNIGMGSEARGGMGLAGPAGMDSMGLAGLGDLPGIGIGSAARGGMRPAGAVGMGSMGLGGLGLLPGISIGNTGLGGMGNMGLGGLGQVHSNDRTSSNQTADVLQRKGSLKAGQDPKTQFLAGIQTTTHVSLYFRDDKLC